MYPRISDIFQDLFGFSFPLPIYSFGLMVAAAVLTAAWLLRRELDRMYRAGLIPSVRIRTGAKGKGRNVYEQVSPGMLVGTATLLAVASGFAGAKLFHILENLDDFARNPLAMIFSSGGFTFYGGLIVAGFVIAWYSHRHRIPIWRFGDAVAPGLMIGYGIGRIGCHLSGDGDWGIASNMAAKPDWLPMWLWAETYPRNILGEVIPPPGVYPAPLYEFGMALVLFGILWALRRHAFRPGWLFSLYLVFAGIERLLIEQIRVNNRFDLFGVSVTQAEVISVILIVSGIIGLALTTRRSVMDTGAQVTAAGA